MIWNEEQLKIVEDSLVTCIEECILEFSQRTPINASELFKRAWKVLNDRGLLAWGIIPWYNLQAGCLCFAVAEAFHRCGMDKFKYAVNFVDGEFVVRERK